MCRHDALSQEYDPDNAAAPEVSETPAKSTPAKCNWSLGGTKTCRPSMPMKKDGTVCILNTLIMHYVTDFKSPIKQL